MSEKKHVRAQSKESSYEKINASFTENALKMLKKRYLVKREDGTQETPAEMFERVARALAHVEKKYDHDDSFVKKVEKDFFEILSTKEYTPAGRTMTNAGAPTPLVANCIVLPIQDTMESIFQTLKDAALLQQAGSGLGFDFSHLRPAFTMTKRSRGVSSGPVSFLKVYNEAFGMIKQQGRHGANMAMMQIDHPDVLDFIRAKEVEGEIRNFNISIKVTDAFMEALVNRPNEQWYCEWNGIKTKPHRVIRATNGAVTGVEEITVTVKELFDEIVNYAWLNGEPGIVFIDQVNRTNPLPGLGPIDCSNPCGEQFLHHYDNCNLGSINLSEFVKEGKVNWQRLKWVTKTAVRMMDNVIDLFDFPVQQVTDLAKKNRRIGLGIMGFGDLLYQVGVGYNSEEGRRIAEKVMKTISDAAHDMSRELAKEKSPFPNLKFSIYQNDPHRNAALTTVAPTGSISMMFDCSSGIEPNFALAYIKQDKDGLKYHYFNRHFESALKKYNLSEEKTSEIKEIVINTGSVQQISGIPEELKKTFVVSMDISAEDHILMQSSFQKHVDNSISKTINFPNSATKEEVEQGYILGWKSGCKSTTVYRDGSRNVQILNIGTGENIIAPTEIGKGTVKVEVKAVEQVPLNLEIDRQKIKPRTRPEVMEGKTYRVKTGYGNLYVTINNDENGAPFEVFAIIGKSGGFFQEQSEGICRLVSLSLRAGVKVEEVIGNLKGIRGPMPVMTNKGTILSLPDAIGQVLDEHVRTNSNRENPMLQQKPEDQALHEMVAISNKEPISVYEKKSIADFGMMPGCPDCGGPLTMGEGCMSCKSCGFSRCM